MADYKWKQKVNGTKNYNSNLTLTDFFCLGTSERIASNTPFSFVKNKKKEKRNQSNWKFKLKTNTGNSN